MKKYLSTGFIILLPIALTVWIVKYLFDLFTAPLYNIVENLVIAYEESQGLSLLHHKTFVTFTSRIIAFILTFLLILGLGFLGRKFFFKRLVAWFNNVLLKIPVVSTIYRLTKDITKAMLATDQKMFKQTVIVPFPSESMHTLGFVTGQTPPEILNHIPEAKTTVFIPTAPHPISGYLLFCDKESLATVQISTEDTMKFLLSIGTAKPQGSS
ncbi:MAG: DUF502 domain-containing protein [Verrucomicrobia bacterium]|nr:DUF502 domain-containing protein [Verrucomicrobiota bacterium]